MFADEELAVLKLAAKILAKEVVDLHQIQPGPGNIFLSRQIHYLQLADQLLALVYKQYQEEKLVRMREHLELEKESR